MDFVNEDIRPFAGNYVLIQGLDATAFIAHMRCGSIRVTKGQSVKTGEIIGEVGNSGFSLVPHIHFQLMNGNDPLKNKIIPFKVRQFEQWNGTSWKLIINGFIEKGMVIRNTD